MDYGNNDMGQIDMVEERFQAELEHTISQQVQNPPLLVNTKSLLS